MSVTSNRNILLLTESLVYNRIKTRTHVLISFGYILSILGGLHMRNTIFLDELPAGLIIVTDELVLIGSDKNGKGEEK